MNTEIFHPAFFGYSNLPDSIEFNGQKLVPIKAIRVKYQGKSQSSGAFNIENIRCLCDFLEIELHRPVRGLYCIEECYANFFEQLYNFYVKHVSSYIHFPGYFYNSNGDLMWGITNWHTGEASYQKKCDGNVIKNLFNSYFS
jgi:hypothetical protein